MVDNTSFFWFCEQKPKTTELPPPPKKIASSFGKSNLFLIITNKTSFFGGLVDYLISDFFPLSFPLASHL